MGQRKLVQITLGTLTSTIYIATSMLVGAIVGGCANPVKETYGKGVEGRQKAIEKARGVENQVDESARQRQEQAEKIEVSQ
jgi:hypothetical protein